DVRMLDRPFDLLSVDLRLDHLQTLVFERAEAIRSGGRVDARGEIDLSTKVAGVKAEVEGEGLPLRDLMGSFGTFAGLAGSVAAKGTLSGTTEDLSISGNLTATSIAAKGVALPDARLDLRPLQGAVAVEGPVCGAGTIKGTVRLASGLPFEARLTL